MRSYFFILLQLCLVLAYSQKFSGLAYQEQTAQQKMDQLWKQITSNKIPSSWFSNAALGKIFLENMSVTFDTYSDVLPEGRNKYIHTIGSVVQAELIAEPNPYTGMFKGVSNVLIRISTAKQPNPNNDPNGNFLPGMGIKLLRDNVPSANLLAMYGVDGQDSWNPFKYDWSNHIPDPEGLEVKLLGKKFAQATPYIGAIGLKTWGQYDEKGKPVSNADLNIPFMLVFRATDKTRNLFPDEYAGLLTNQLKKIPSGTALFDVLAMGVPDADLVKIATIKTKSEFVTSNFGDVRLFFQHNYFEDDIQLHPNWKQAISSNPSIIGRLKKIFHR